MAAPLKCLTAVSALSLTVKMFPVLLLLATAIASSGAEDQQQKVAISDDTELVDDVGTGGSAATPAVPEAEPVVERTEDSKHTSAEVPREVSDETEIEAEPEEQLRDPVSPATTSADPLDLMKVRRKQLEETLVHIRSNFLKRRSLISAQDIRTEDAEYIDISGDGPSGKCKDVQASPYNVLGSQQNFVDEHEATTDSKVTDNPTTVSIHLTITKEPSRERMASTNTVGVQSVSTDPVLDTVNRESPEVIQKNIKEESRTFEDVMFIDDTTIDRHVQETDDADSDDEVDSDDDEDEFYEEEDGGDDMEEAAANGIDYETDVADDSSNAQFFELYEDLGRDEQLTVNRPSYSEISMPSSLSSLHVVSDDSQIKPQDLDKLKNDDIGFPDSAIKNDRPSEDITRNSEEKHQMTHQSHGTDKVEVQSPSAHADEQKLPPTVVIADDNTNVRDRETEFTENSENTKGTNKTEDLLTNSVAETQVENIPKVDEAERPSEDITRNSEEKPQMTHQSRDTDKIEVQSPSAHADEQKLPVTVVIADDNTNAREKETEFTENSENTKGTNKTSEDLLTNSVARTQVENILKVDETEMEERLKNDEKQQDHKEDTVTANLVSNTEDSSAKLGQNKVDQIETKQTIDDINKDMVNQKTLDENQPEIAETKVVTAESESVGKEIKETVDNQLEAEAMQEVSTGKENIESERNEAVETPDSSYSEEGEKTKQQDELKMYVDDVSKTKEFSLDEDNGDSKTEESSFKSEKHSSEILTEDDSESTEESAESDSKTHSGTTEDTVADEADDVEESYEEDTEEENEEDTEEETDMHQSEVEESPEVEVGPPSDGTEDLPHAERHIENDFYQTNNTQNDESESVSEAGSESFESIFNASDSSHSAVEENQQSIISEDDGHEQSKDRAWHSSSEGFGLDSLLSGNEVKTDSNLDKFPVHESVKLPDDKVKYSSSDADYESLKAENGKDGELKSEEFSEFESQDESPDKSTPSSFTLKPYVVILEGVLSNLDPYLEDVIHAMPSNLQRLFLKAPFAFTPPRNLLLFAGSCLSLLMVLSCQCLGSSKQRSRQNEKNGLLQKLSSIQGTLLISEQEKEAVAGELESLKKQCQDFRKQSNVSTEQADQLSERISELTKENETLQGKVTKQQTHNSDLSAKVSSQSESIKKVSEKNKALQKNLDETATRKNLLETQLREMQTTLQQSQNSAIEMQLQLKSMTEEIAILQTSKDQLLLEAEGWNEKVQEQEDQISKLLEQEKTMLESNGLKDKELSVLRDCYQQLKLFENSLDYIDSANGEVDGEEDEEAKKKQLQDEVQLKIKSMIDVAQINARLNASEEEKSSLKNALKIEIESRMELEDQTKQMKADMEKLMESRLEAEQQASTTAIKMDVLVNYFKEKETELTRKLGEQEAREKASADQLVSTDEKTKGYEKMVHLYKEQVEDLQKEIQNIEADYRKQIALQEKKAHENWLVARQSERDVKEYKAEAQILRLKILELQNRLDAVAGESKVVQDSGQAIPGIANGVISLLPSEERPTSRPLLQNPPFGLPPPFPPGPLPPPLFGHPLPPPPLPPMMFDRRQPDMRSSPSFDMWPPPSHLHARSPALPRDRSPPRIRSPSPLRRGASPDSQRSRVSPASLRSGRYSPSHSRNRSPPSAIGDRHSPYIHGPRVPLSSAARPVRPPYNRIGHDSRPGP